MALDPNTDRAKVGSDLDSCFNIRAGGRRREGRPAEVVDPAEDALKPMIRRGADFCSLVRDLQQAGAKGGRGESLRNLDRSAARRSSQARGQESAGDSMPIAHLALN